MNKKLDEQFGVVGRRPGNHVRHLERKHRPLSLFELSPDNEWRTNELIVLSNLASLTVLSESVSLLWSVTRTGVIKVAFEELVELEAGCLGKVFNPSMLLRTGIQKLGHPSLIDDDMARISGELYLDEGTWVINNKSGRFGFLDDRCVAQLQNVASVFSSFGLPVEVDFIAPH